MADGRGRCDNSGVLHRFFAPSLDPGDELVDLSRDESEHLKRVLRIGVGDTVAVFDGRGHEYLAKVASAERRDVRLQILSPIEAAAESTIHITLVQAVLKGDKMDDVVRDAVMMGVATVQPIVSRRSETSVAALVRGARLERWRRIALASVKQSRRAVLPEILTPLTFESWLAEPPSDVRLMFVEPGIDGAEPMATLRTEPVPASAAVIVGPEGGWDPSECQAAATRGVRRMSLGARTLRADAVPVAALSVLDFLWDASC